MMGFNSPSAQGPLARKGAGFTLIELMVTLVVAAILATVAAPSFIQFQRNAELTSVTNSLVAAINAARADAMKRGKNAFVVPANNGGGNAWATGWVAFVDLDRNGQYDAAKDFTVFTQGPTAGYIAIAGNGTANETPAYIMFDSSGFIAQKKAGFAALTLSLSRSDLSGTAQAQETRRIKIAKTGRVRTCRPASTADTTCSEKSNDGD